jgi:hypothetical protein
MKKITLNQTLVLLEQCSAVIVDDNTLIYPRVDGDSEEFLFISWEEEGEEYIVTFNKDDNKEVSIKGAKLTLIDSEGNGCDLTLLTPMGEDEM